MKINFYQITQLTGALREIIDMNLPFKLSLILAKDFSKLNEEEKFFIEQERNFVQKFLVINEETGELVQEAPGVFRIKEGMDEECHKARKELDEFEVEIDLLKIPASLLNDLSFTPKQLMALADLIEEE